MNGGDETFPAALDQWTPKDWQEYRRRTEDGEGSVRTIDAITRRRTRTAPETVQAPDAAFLTQSL